MISSFIDGRVRIRHKALKDPEFMATIRDTVAGQDGVLEVRDNPKTGSLLVRYDPAVISHDKLLMAAQMLENTIPEKAAPKSGACSPRKMARRKETALLSGLYALTLIGGFTNIRLHMAAGGLFTLLAARHLFARRNCL